MKQIKKVNKRFSMFEVLVVLAVLSILASLIFSSVGYARDEASRTQCLNNLHQIQAVIEVYRKDHRVTPPASNVNDFSFAREYVDKLSREIFHCPGDPAILTDLILDIDSSYEYIPCEEDVERGDFDTLIEFLMIYDKDASFHQGRYNVLYIHGDGNRNGGIARTEDNRPGVLGDPEGDPEGEGRTNNGHGNNEDGIDMSNPGNAPKHEDDTDNTVDDEKKTGQGNINDQEFDDYVDKVNRGQNKPGL